MPSGVHFETNKNRYESEIFTSTDSTPHMTPDERQSDTGSVQVMAKAVGPICNLNCGYCFYLEKVSLYPTEKQWKMPIDVLESFIRQHIVAQTSSHVSFVWQGGEPTLLGVDYFAKVLELEQKYAGAKKVDNALQTNGTLLDDEWCSFLARNQFLVGISIDGPRELHDRFRLNKARHGSFDQVMHGLELLKKHNVEFNTLTVVHRHNSLYPLEIYRFLKHTGSRFLQFIPIVERVPTPATATGLRLSQPGFNSEASVTEWSVEPLQYGTFLCSVFDEWARHDVGSVFVQLFDVALESWLGMHPNLCLFRETCGDALVLEHNGDLYACDHFVYPEYLLGNIGAQSMQTLASSIQQRKFGRDKLDTLPKFCRECPVRFACNGECPKHRFLCAPDGEYGLNYLCSGYKKFFQYIDQPMRFMAEELMYGRPPSNVMRWMHARDTIPRRRNDPCFCGSGRKYKHCHGV